MTIATVSPEEFANFDGRNVLIVVAQPDGSAAELTGKVEAAGPAGIAFKEKGKRDITLLEPAQVIEISRIPEKPKPIVQRKMKPVTESNVRQHLSDRHGFPRSHVNSMEPDQALAEHDAIDHSDLGHKHVEDKNEEESESTNE